MIGAAVARVRNSRNSDSRSNRRPPGEFDLITRLTSELRRSPRTILGPGDDCAILRRPPGAQLFTIDSMVEGVHFDLGWGTPELLGARALEVNLSDIAAMGGEPWVCVVNLGVRDGLDTSFFQRLYRGLSRAAREAGVDLAGGNITSAKQLTITIALLGDAPVHPLRRDAARPGDDIFVTGTLGDAALGWRILAGKLEVREGGARKHLIDRALAPSARVAAGRALAKLLPAAAIDISDGLLQDLGHILERSEVGAEIDPRSLPLSSAYREVMGGDLSHALTGGEDYELLFCARAGSSARELTRRLGIQVTRIGRIVRGSGTRIIDAPELSRRIAANRGWDQLRDGH